MSLVFVLFFFLLYVDYSINKNNKHILTFRKHTFKPPLKKTKKKEKKEKHQERYKNLFFMVQKNVTRNNHAAQVQGWSRNTRLHQRRKSAKAFLHL